MSDLMMRGLGKSNTGSSQLPDTWVAASSLPGVRYGYAIVMLNNGKPLFIGGTDNTTALAACYLYDEASDTWTVTGSMASGRQGFAAIKLANGNVLVAGGVNGAESTSCQLYDATNGTWGSAGSMSIARRGPDILALLNDGTVLAAGGTSSLTTEIYDPGTNTWTNTLGALTREHKEGAIFKLNSSLVYVFTGTRINDGTLAEVFTPATGLWATTGVGAISCFSVEYFGTVGIRLASGRAFQVSVDGIGAGNKLTCQLTDATLGTTFTSAANVNVGRYVYGIVLAGTTAVLLIGGYGNAGYLSSVESYSVANNTWTLVTSMSITRAYIRPVALTSGRILVAGGVSSGGATATCEIYQPA